MLLFVLFPLKLTGKEFIVEFLLTYICAVKVVVVEKVMLTLRMTLIWRLKS